MRTTTRKAFACAIALFRFLPFTGTLAQSAVTVTEQEAYEIGVEAYTYLYPLVLMDVTRRQAVNVEAGKIVGRGPMNTFTNVRTFPPPTSAMSCGRTSTPCTPSPGWTSRRNR